MTNALKFLIALFMINICCSCNSEFQVDKNKLANVVIKKVQIEEIHDLMTYPARVRAKINSTILSETDGIVTRVHVTLGMKVRSTQTLMILNHTDPIYQYAPVAIRSPVDGFVSSIDVTPGSHVVRSQKLAAVINPAQLEIQVEIPAQDLGEIQRGMNGEFKLPGQEKVLSVQVVGVSPFVDPNTGTALAQLSIGDRGKLLLSPGLQGQAVFKTNKHLGFLIPDHSIIYKGKDTFIKAVVAGRIKQLPVTLGNKRRGIVEVLNGLSTGMEVVERSSRFVADGESVVEEEGR